MKKLKKTIKKVLVFTSYTALLISFYFAFFATFEAVKVNEGMIFMYYSISDFLLQTEPTYLFFKYGKVFNAFIASILSLFSFIFLKYLSKFNTDDIEENYVDFIGIDISLKAEMAKELYPYPIKQAMELSATYNQITNLTYDFNLPFEENMNLNMFLHVKNEKKKTIISKLYTEYECEMQKYMQESWKQVNELFCLCSNVIIRNSNLSRKKQLYIAKTMYYLIFKNTHVAFERFGINEPKNYDEVFLDYLKYEIYF